MQWLMVCCVLSLLSAIECAGVKGKHCPEQKPSAPPSPVPPANLSAPIILNINQLRDVKKSSTAGGYGGDKFSDPVESRELVQIYSITIWHGEKVEGIEVVYIDSEGWEYRANHHGSNEGDKIDTVALDSEHVIVRIEGFTDYNYVGSISFVVENTVTGERATHGPYGQDSALTLTPSMGSYLDFTDEKERNWMHSELTTSTLPRKAQSLEEMEGTVGKTQSMHMSLG